jgi:hypothetical protein
MLDMRERDEVGFLSTSIGPTNPPFTTVMELFQWTCGGLGYTKNTKA